MTQDDAGKPVPLVRFNLSYFPIAIGPLPREVQRVMTSAAMNETWKARSFLSAQGILRGAWMGLIPATASFGGFALINYSGLLRGPNASLVIILLFLFLTPLLMYVMFTLAPLALTDQVRKRCADTAAQAGYCGSCGYGLHQPTTPETPLCTCAECGAAWASPALQPAPN